MFLKSNPFEAIYDPSDDGLESFDLEMLVIVDLYAENDDTVSIRYVEFDARLLADKSGVNSVKDVKWAIIDEDWLFDSYFYR